MKGGHAIGKFDGKEVVEVPGTEPNTVPWSGVIMTADLYGDFRDELVVQKIGEDGLPEVIVLTATDPINYRYVAPTENMNYRLWLARNKGGGYGSDYYQELEKLAD